ncbi:hypothetical protein, partial [Roseisolibacter sp. H3M3-2]|uniref:hypothetical protein n=1 Tax=Roseisolibacter sp. H3M3-2 TaxID=3031323 RepID=UPI0023DAB1FF
AMNSITSPAGRDTMSPWVEALLAKYGAVIIGLLFGTSAKYALAMIEGQKVTIRMLVIDVLAIGMIAIVAMSAVERAGASGSTAALLVALIAVSSDRLLRLLREIFLRRLDRALTGSSAEPPLK